MGPGVEWIRAPGRRAPKAFKCSPALKKNIDWFSSHQCLSSGPLLFMTVRWRINELSSALFLLFTYRREGVLWTVDDDYIIFTFGRSRAEEEEEEDYDEKLCLSFFLFGRGFVRDQFLKAPHFIAFTLFVSLLDWIYTDNKMALRWLMLRKDDHITLFSLYQFGY